MKVRTRILYLVAGSLWTVMAGPVGAGEASAEWRAGKAALEDGHYAIAIGVFSNQLDQADSRKERLAAALHLVEAYAGTGRYNEAAEVLGRFRDSASRDPGFVYWQARVLLELGDPGSAREVLDRSMNILEDSGYEELALRLKGRVLAERAGISGAEETFRTYQERYGDGLGAPGNLLDWALALDRSTRRSDAIRKLEELEDRYPESNEADQARLWLAYYWSGRSEPEKAMGYLEPLTRDDARGRSRDRAEGWLAKGRILEAGGDVTNALEAVVQSIALFDKAPQALDARLDQARILITLERVEEAVSLLESNVQAVAGSDKGGKLLMKLGDLLSENDRHERALDAYQQYIEAFPAADGLAYALYGKAWSLFYLERYAEAALTFEKASDLFSSAAKREASMIKMADSYFANSQFKLALAAYEQTRSLFSNSTQRAIIDTQVAECLARQGDLEASEAAFRKVADRYPADPVAGKSMLRVAELKEQSGDWPKALEVYDDYLKRFERDEEQVTAIMNRGLLHYRTGAYELAISDFDAVIARFGNSSWEEQARFMRICGIYHQGDAKGALDLADDFITDRTRSKWRPNVMYWLAQHHFNSRNYEESELLLAGLAADHPDSDLADDALFWSGRSAAERKEFRRAIERFGQLIKQYPGSPRMVEARFAQGDSLSEMGEYAGAILAYDEIIREHPGTKRAALAMGRKGDCLFTLGSGRPERYREAAVAFKTLAGSPVADAELQLEAEFKLGRTYEKLDRGQEAFEAYMRVVYLWLAEREEGHGLSDMWLVRSAFHAAAMKESEGLWDEAVQIYRRVVDAGVPASGDAAARIHDIREQPSMRRR